MSSNPSLSAISAKGDLGQDLPRGGPGATVDRAAARATDGTQGGLPVGASTLSCSHRDRLLGADEVDLPCSEYPATASRRTRAWSCLHTLKLARSPSSASDQAGRRSIGSASTSSNKRS